MPFRCPYCKQSFAAAERSACPACGRVLRMPRSARRPPRSAPADPAAEAPRAPGDWPSSGRRLGRTGNPLAIMGASGLKVVAILVILMGIGGALVSQSKAPPPDLDARKIDRSRLSLANLRVALEMYRQDCGAYPSTEDGLAALIHPPSPATGWQGPYINELKNDLWGNPFHYRLAETNLCLFGCGPDRQPDTADDLAVERAAIALRLEEGLVHAIVDFRDGDRKIVHHAFPVSRAIRADLPHNEMSP